MQETSAIDSKDQTIEILREQVVTLTNTVQDLILAHKDLSSRVEVTVDYTAGIIKLFQDGKMPVAGAEFLKAISDNKVMKFDENVKKLIQKGILKRVSDVTPLAKIVVEESNLKTGEMMNYRVFLDMQEIKPEFKDILLGKKTGDQVAFSGAEDNDGSTIKVIDILEPVTQSS